MINVEADRLREPAAWLMVAVASTRVLIGIERLLFGTPSLKDASFALRAAGHVEDLTSPVIPALLVGAVLLAGHAGPAIERLRLTIQVAVGTLGLAVLFGTVGLFGGLFAGETVLREKAEFLVGSLPALALTAIALFYLLPKAALAGSQGDALSSGDLRADTGSRRSRQQRPQEPRFQEPRQEPRSQEQRSLEQYGAAHGHLPHGAPVHPQSAPVHPQGGQSPQGFHPQDPAQGGPAYSQEQTPQQGLRSPEQGAPQGFQQHEQAAPQGFPSHDQAPQQGFHAQEQTPQQGLRSPEQTPQQGFPSPEQGAPQGFQQHERATQGGHAYPQQQFQPVPQLPYSPPALPPAPASSSAEGHGGPQQAHGYPAPSGDVYGAPYGQPAESQPYGGWSGSHAQSPAQPAHQAPAAATEVYNSGSYPPGSYVPADAQPQPHAQPQAPGQAQATLYDPPPSVYDPPIYSERSQSSVYADPAVYAEPSPPAYVQPADSRLTGYSHQSEQPTSFYGTQPAASPYASADSRPQPSFDSQAQHSFPQSPQPEQQGSFYGSQPEAPVASPYASVDSHPPLSFDSQAQHAFPPPPDDYGQPPTGYPGSEYGRQTEPNLRYSAPAPAPAPDPVDPRSQQMAQAYQQAESYQQQSQGTDPQLRPEYTGSQPGGSYDDPFGHPQTPPAQQPYQQGDHRWDSLAETAPRLDTSAYRGDPLSGPSPVARPWDSQPIDPTAIYKPERSAQVTGEETPDRERVGPGQEQNMSWYGSDRREH
ncbi:hypothetical protein [Streptosporangium sp. NPDC004631]